MSEQDEFTAREMLGLNKEPVSPQELREKLRVSPETLANLDMTEDEYWQTIAEKKAKKAQLAQEAAEKRNAELRATAEQIARAAGTPDPISHPRPEAPSLDSIPEDALQVAESPIDQDMLPDDEEHRIVFNGTLFEGKDLSAAQLQKHLHMCARLVRRTKIQMLALRRLMEPALTLITPEERAIIRERDAEFIRSRGKVAEASPKQKKAVTTKKATGLSEDEKLIQQLIKLGNDQADIIAIFAAKKRTLPENLNELIARFSK